MDLPKANSVQRKDEVYHKSENMINKLGFQLEESFVDQYRERDPEFGFNGLGLLTYFRTYARIKGDGTSEQWYETVRRVVEGCYSLQKEHIIANHLGWNDTKAQMSAQEMYDRIFCMKFLPPGRMLWALGTPIIHEKRVGQALFNCAFVSTDQIGSSRADAVQPFAFMMDMSMVGVGVGFDVAGAGKVVIHPPEGHPHRFVIPDTREGWVESLEMVLDAYFSCHFTKKKGLPVTFDYSQIREAGQLIRGFGGIASGPGALQHLHSQLDRILNAAAGHPITVTLITDIMNLIGQCVVAGNVRRTAQIALGDPADEEYLTLKDYRWDSQEQKYIGNKADRAVYGWASNNSVLVDHTTNFTRLARQTAVNGEPGFVFLDNVRAYSRMLDAPDYKDRLAKGTNPCGEQTLESFELCCLVETFPSRASSRDDFMRTLKFAYMVGKTATLVSTTWHKTNRVQKRNRRIGTSVTGITDFLQHHSLDTLRNWLEEGYHEIQRWDEIYSAWLCVPRSIKTTSVKPSGTVSLLAGVNPGCHYPEFEYYIRRVRISKLSPLLPSLHASGYWIEDDLLDPSSAVVAFPVHNPGRNLSTISIWEQVSLAAFLQKYWADNQVSCTVTFNPDEADQIAPVLDYFKYQLKSISFLPRLQAGAYAQMPYEAITRMTYEEMVNNITSLQQLEKKEDAEAERFCTTDYCLM